MRSIMSLKRSFIHLRLNATSADGFIFHENID